MCLSRNAKEDHHVQLIHSSHRRSASTIIGTMALATSLTVAGATTATAQSAGTPNKKALVGTWLETVWFPPETGRPPLKSLSSYHDDETMVCSDQGNVTLEPPSVFSSCHGAWTHLEKRTFAYTAFELISDLSGNLVGYLKVRGIFTVSQSGNEYNGNSFARDLRHRRQRPLLGRRDKRGTADQGRTALSASLRQTSLEPVDHEQVAKPSQVGVTVRLRVRGDHDAFSHVFDAHRVGGREGFPENPATGHQVHAEDIGAWCPGPPAPVSAV